MVKINNILRLLKQPNEIKQSVYRRIPASLLWNQYGKLCRSAGLNKPYFVLSFDCDTDEDIKVAWDVHSRLMDINVKPVYAVPGELLKRGQKTYRKIFETGSQFINHGYREHTYFDKKKGVNVSSFFYEEQNHETLREDIISGHAFLQDILGVCPEGWRTPHFGTFQEAKHFKFLYSTLKELNYRFSSSTLPQKNYEQGFCINNSEIIEFPVTGTWSEPMNILDTWAFFGAPDRQKNAKDYHQECLAIHRFSMLNPVLINIYGDPSHIANEPLFFDSMKILAQGAKNCNFSELLDVIQ